MSCAGYHETVDILIRNGADLNARNDFGETALHKAVQLYGKSY